MRYRFTPKDESLPWFGAEVRVVGPLGTPMDALLDVLEALNWRMEDLNAFQHRTTLASFEQRAKRRGEDYDGPPSNITARDEVLINQWTAFASLRAAGYAITWEQAQSIALTDYAPVSESSAEQTLLDEAGEDASKDPLPASTDSAPAVDADTLTPTPEPTGPHE